MTIAEAKPLEEKRGWSLKRPLSFAAFWFVAILLMPSLARADGGVEIVNYRCDPKAHFVYVGTAVSYDILSDFGKDIISLNDMKEDVKVLECQISSKGMVVVRIGKSNITPRNNNVNITINGKYLDNLLFSTMYDYSYLINETIMPNSYNVKGIQIIKKKKTIETKVHDWDPDAN